MDPFFANGIDMSVQHNVVSLLHSLDIRFQLGRRDDKISVDKKQDLTAGGCGADGPTDIVTEGLFKFDDFGAISSGHACRAVG